MHDLIEDMGKYIVKMQKDSGKPSRIWDFEDFEEAMVDYRLAMTVEAIWFQYSDERFSKEAMKNMQRLRILFIQYSYPEEIDGSFDYLSNNLRWFFWQFYPWKLLPQNFNPTRLVHLKLQHSSLHHFWNETKQLPSLQSLDLFCSKRLKRTPNFTGMPNLEYLDLSFCRSLEEVHHSLRCSKKLIELNLIGCNNLKKFPYVNVESLKYLNLEYCSSLEKLPEILGKMKPELNIKMLSSGIREIPSSIIHPQAHLTELDLSGMKNLVSLPSSVCKLKDLVKLDVSKCSKLESLPEEIGGLENLEQLHAPGTLISRPSSSIVRLNKLKVLNLSCCNLIDGGLPEDIGSLSSLEELNLSENNFEHLPHSIAQLGALRSLNLSHCDKLKEFPGFTEMPNLVTLNLSCCNLIDGGLPEDIVFLFSLEELNLSENNFEHLPRSIAQLGALRSLDLSGCDKLTQLPEIPQQLDRIDADWSNDWICYSLFQNISSLQHDIFVSDSLSLRVFTSCWMYIPSWFHHRVKDTSISVNLPENWYISDNFLGFAVCYYGCLMDDITAHLIPLCDDGTSWMTQKFALSKPSNYDIHFFLVPLAGLWDASMANGKTPNDYRCFRLCSPGNIDENVYGAKVIFLEKFGVRLLYKDITIMTGAKRENPKASLPRILQKIGQSFLCF